MLEELSKQINTELQEEQDRKDFYELIHEDFEFDTFLDNNILNLSENGVNNEMLKNEMPFLFIEDTAIDNDVITTLQDEVEYEDNYDKKPIFDLNDTTRLQEPEDFDDDFSIEYASDADSDTRLTREEDYSDNQKTPVNIDEFSNEAADILFEMGDILGALSLLEDEDMIDQADEADVDDTEYPDMPEGVVMEEEDFEPEDETLESFYSLFEDADSDDDEDDSDDEDDDEEDEDDDEDSDDEEDEECDDDDCDEDDEVEECGKNCVKESFDFFDYIF